MDPEVKMVRARKNATEDLMVATPLHDGLSDCANYTPEATKIKYCETGVFSIKTVVITFRV